MGGTADTASPFKVCMLWAISPDLTISLLSGVFSNPCPHDFAFCLSLGSSDICEDSLLLRDS